MNLVLLIPIILGSVGILQGTINKQVAGSLGIAHAVLLSNFITFLICVAFYFIVKTWPQYFPSLFHVKASIGSFKWWYIFPAIFGFCIVAGMPFVFAKVGAAKATILLVTSQIMTGVIWDILVENLPLTTNKVIAVVFAGLSVVFTLL